MKAHNLQRLVEAGIRVPPFIVVDDASSFDVSQLDALPGEVYAVRSSYAGEDGESYSYAGQFESYLGVSKQDVPARLADVFSSMKNTEIYDDATAVPDGARVIIQTMVHSEWSGVCFSANPAGIMNESVVVIGEGLGDKVVSDAIDTHTWYYNRDSEILFGGSDVIAREVIMEIVSVAHRIEKLFSSPVDIEFAYENGTLFIVQARPITTLPPNPAVILDNSNLVENYPDITLPLTQSFMRRVYGEIMASVMRRATGNDRTVMSHLDEHFDEMVLAADHRLYYRLDNWYRLLWCLPLRRKIISIWQDSLGVSNRSLPASLPPISFWKRCAIAPRIARNLARSQKDMRQFGQWFEQRYDVYAKAIEEQYSVESLLALYEQMYEEIIPVWDITLINDMYAFLFMALVPKDEKAEVSNSGMLASMKPVYACQELIDVARKHGMESEEYAQKAQKYIDDFGDRVPGELKLETHTYRTNPELFDGTISALCEDGTPLENVRPRTASGRLSWVKRAAISGVAHREMSRLDRTRLFGLVRRIFLRIATILHDEGVLDDVDDIFYLHVDEIGFSGDVRELIAERKHSVELARRLPSVSRLEYAHDVIVHAPVESATATTSYSSDFLQGTGTSAGVVRGEVVVLKEPPRTPIEGKIVVLPSTDPGWILSISRAAAIVSERGSLLSHTAIISRELGIPSVVGVADVTSMLRSGDIVEVDGSAGTVRKVEA